MSLCLLPMGVSRNFTVEVISSQMRAISCFLLSGIQFYFLFPEFHYLCWLFDIYSYTLYTEALISVENKLHFKNFQFSLYIFSVLQYKVFDYIL